MNNDGHMDIHEFSIAMKLIKLKLQGHPLPPTLPPSMKQPPLPLPRQTGFGKTKIKVQALTNIVYTSNHFFTLYLFSRHASLGSHHGSPFRRSTSPSWSVSTTHIIWSAFPPPAHHQWCSTHKHDAANLRLLAPR